MADFIPLKANFTGAAATSIAEFQASDTIPVAMINGAATLGTAQTFAAAKRGGVTALTVASNLVAVDMALGNNFSLSLQATTGQTLSNPTNMTAGQSGQIAVLQNATPSTLAYGSYWVPYDGTTPAVSTTAGAQNLISYYVVDSTHVWFSLAKHGVA